MKKVLIILLILSITIIAYAAFTGAGVRFVRPLHPQVNTVGLIAHYKMWDGLMTTGEIFDYTCTGKDGTLVDTDTPKTLIPTYPGFNFDGGNDYISIDDHDDFTPGGNNLVGGGDFATGDWDGDDPDPTYWVVTGEVGADPEISEVGAGQGHGGAGTGMCNLYTSDGTIIQGYQDIAVIVGRKYRFSINIDTVTAGKLSISEANHSMWVPRDFVSGDEGIHTWTFTATYTDIRLLLKRGTVAECDITFDDISITPVKPFSISAWVNMDEATDFTIASKGVINVSGEWWFFTNIDDRVSIRHYDNSVGSSCAIGRYCTPTLTSYENQWIHLVATSDGGILPSAFKIYLNGVRFDTSNVQVGTFVSVENLAAPVHIGRYLTSYADGVIDDMMFFGKELSTIEVRNIYEVTRWRYQK